MKTSAEYIREIDAEYLRAKGGTGADAFEWQIFSGKINREIRGQITGTGGHATALKQAHSFWTLRNRLLAHYANTGAYCRAERLAWRIKREIRRGGQPL